MTLPLLYTAKNRKIIYGTCQTATSFLNSYLLNSYLLNRHLLNRITWGSLHHG